MLGGNGIRCDVLLHPLLQRTQCIKSVWPRSAYAMLHPGNHEEARMLLEFFVPSVFLRQVFVEPNAAVGRNNQIVVTVVNQQLSSLFEEGSVPGWIIRYVPGKPVVHKLERGRLNHSVILDRVIQVHARIVIAQSQENSRGKIPISW